jgi:hypothetical protein
VLRIRTTEAPAIPAWVLTSLTVPCTTVPPDYRVMLTVVGEALIEYWLVLTRYPARWRLLPRRNGACAKGWRIQFKQNALSARNVQEGPKGSVQIINITSR